MSRCPAGWGRLAAVSLLAGLGFLAGCAQPPASPEADGDAVPRPEWRVGDRWVFRRTPLSGMPAVVTHQVVAAAADGYTLRVQGLVPAVTQTWTTDLHLRRVQVAGQAASDFEPAARYFSWPLTLGKSWTQEFEYRDGRHDGRYANTWRVGVTVESLQVLAGSFYAVRIERRGPGGERLETYWYTPRVRYWVRLESSQGGYTDELVEFTGGGA